PDAQLRDFDRQGKLCIAFGTNIAILAGSEIERADNVRQLLGKVWDASSGQTLCRIERHKYEQRRPATLLDLALRPSANPSSKLLSVLERRLSLFARAVQLRQFHSNRASGCANDKIRFLSQNQLSDWEVRNLAAEALKLPSFDFLLSWRT